MTKPQRFGSIEISQDMKFQERSWRVQRAAWIVMLLITLAALAGLFGDGFLARGSAGSPSSALGVNYARFTRLGSNSVLEAEIASASIASDSTVRVWVDREWIDGYEILSITPEPETTELLADRAVYTFKFGPAAGKAKVKYSLDARVMGLARGRIGLDGGPSYHFSQFIYP